jgi:hypothetical protein
MYKCIPLTSEQEQLLKNILEILKSKDIESKLLASEIFRESFPSDALFDCHYDFGCFYGYEPIKNIRLHKISGEFVFPEYSIIGESKLYAAILNCLIDKCYFKYRE